MNPILFTFVVLFTECSPVYQTPVAPAPIPYDWSRKGGSQKMRKKMKTDDLMGSMDPISQCYYAITNLTAGGGDRICEEFMELPSQLEYRDYYRKIKDPICLNQIKRKIDKGSFEGYFEEFEQDITLMVNNAKLYNHKDSDVYSYAVKIKDALDEFKEEHGDELENPVSPYPLSSLLSPLVLLSHSPPPCARCRMTMTTLTLSHWRMG